jgi:hypothetical protein
MPDLLQHMNMNSNQFILESMIRLFYTFCSPNGIYVDTDAVPSYQEII